MHPAAFKYVKHSLSDLAKRKSVVEFGGRDINGSVRQLFDAPNYISIDLVDGPGVDVVADAISYKPRFTPDTVICCEVLEHNANWAAIVRAAGRILDETEGVLILTCATDPRIPHSAIDGGYVRGEEYYGNVDPLQLSNVLETCFAEFHIDVDTAVGDLYAIAYKQEKA